MPKTKKMKLQPPQEEDNRTLSTGVQTVTDSIAATFTYDPKKRIKRVGHDSHQQAILVFEGFFNGTTRIALKRYDKGLNDQRTMDQARQELELLSTPEKRHENIIRYFGHWDDDDFLYLATELCDCSVADIIHPDRTTAENKKLHEIILGKLSIKEILRQSTVAVDFIHRQNIIHRNLHPDNFLIFGVEPNKDQYLIKLTDFQRYKNMTENLEKTGTLNSEGWDAPENFPNSEEELSGKTDVFILGCYYFYVLSGGNHPFGSDAVDRQGMKGIKSKDNAIYRNDWNGGPLWNPSQPNREEAMLALNIIKSVIKFNPVERKSAGEILRESYFSITVQNDLDLEDAGGASMDVEVTDEPTPASIFQMISESSESVPVPHLNTAEAWTCKQKMRFNRKKEIYNGGNGVLVYQGFFGGDQPAAVKRFQISEKITKLIVQREAEMMLKANSHAKMDNDFLYLATEFCIGTLQHLVKNELKIELGTSYFFKNEKEILFQVTDGLAHLHSLDIIHKDVKPTNLLIYQPEGITAEMGNWISKQKMRFNRNKELYSGDNGIVVFQGFFGGDQPAAIKRFTKTAKITEFLVQREAELMIKAMLGNHVNILRYFDYEMDDNFLYLATEYCIGTLQHFVEGKLKIELGTSYFFQNEKEILFQVTDGLAHLHSLKIIHKDVKPTNLLIYQPEGMVAVMKVADFGISKSLKPDQEDTTNSSKTNPSGTRGWMAPEQYNSTRYGREVDIFALGLVFGYTLSDGGKHPYGENVDRRAVRVQDREEMDDLKNNYFKEKYAGDGLLIELIHCMLKMDAKSRPTAQDVLKNAFFSNIFQ